MPLKEQTFFIKRLSFLIRAGIPILESLVMIRDQTKHKRHSLILDTAIRDVSNGQYLSTSLNKFKTVFGDFSINIIAFGESSGILSENLNYLAEELKKKDNLRKKIISAFVYPALVTVATLGITVFLMVYLFPKIVPVFASLRVDLPLSTKVVMFLSSFFIKNGFMIILLFIVGFIIFIIFLKKYKKFHFRFDNFLIKLPALGDAVKNYNLANATRAMGLLLKSGIALNETVNITTKVCSNLVYKKEFRSLSKAIDRGEKASTYLANNSELFPEVMTQIISVGERTGNLPDSLIYISELYESEVEDFTKNISNLVEPILMIIMGVLVGFIAISIITPIYSITQNLHG